MNGKKLRRSSTNKMLVGVCGGIAEYLGVDVAIIRIVFVALVIFGQAGILLYVLGWLFLPMDDDGTRGFDDVRNAFNR